MSRAAVVVNPTKLDDDEAFRKSVVRAEATADILLRRTAHGGTHRIPGAASIGLTA